jgi:hypothetical protein
VSDGKDELDGSDWLTSQFTPTEEVPTRTRRQPVAPPPNAEPVFGTPPVVSPPPTSAGAASPPVATPVASAPTANAAGGFNWGLRPHGGSDAPSAPPPAPTPTPPPAPIATPTPASELTQPMSWADFAATQAPLTQSPAAPPPAATTVDQPTQAYTVAPWHPAQAGAAASAVSDYRDQHDEPTSAIDSLFGDHQFQEYEEVGVLKGAQAPILPGSRAEAREPRAPLATSQKALMGIAGGLIGVLVLIGLFFLGERLGAASAASPTSSSTSGAKSTPTSAGSGGPAAPGVQPWTALQGGECIQPFTSAWAVSFTVVNCTSDHDAQMVFKGRLSSSDNPGYPTTSQFQTELTQLCSAPTAINYKAAAAVTDLQVSFSYPPTAQSWIDGDRTYYCFVDRVSGGTLPGDLSVPTSGN